MKYLIASIPVLFVVMIFAMAKNIEWLILSSFLLILLALIAILTLLVAKGVKKIESKFPEKQSVSEAKIKEIVIEKETIVEVVEEKNSKITLKEVVDEEENSKITLKEVVDKNDKEDIEEKTAEVKKVKQKKQKPQIKLGVSKPVFAICVLFGLLALPPLAIEFSEYMVRRTESPQVQSYFNPHFYKSENGDLLTEAELIAKEGQPTSSEEWNYDLPDGRVYQMKTLSYTKENGDSREFSHLKFDDGVFRLVKITLMEWIPYGDKDDILKMFNLQKTNQSIIQDLNVSYRAWNVGVEGFWIPALEPNHFDLVIITYKELL